jgi:hypothetical protein
VSDTPLTDQSICRRIEYSGYGVDRIAVDVSYVEVHDCRAIERELRDELAAARAALAAPEQSQRERMAARFANRGKTAPSADFDLPSASDDFLATEPSREPTEEMIDAWEFAAYRNAPAHNRDELREALRDVMNEADSITGITDATWARAVDILAGGRVT